MTHNISNTRFDNNSVGESAPARQMNLRVGPLDLKKSDKRNVFAWAARMYDESRPPPRGYYALTNSAGSLDRRMLLDLATRRSLELVEVQILYFLAAVVALQAVDPWAIAVGYLLVQVSEVHAVQMVRRIFQSAFNPDDTLARFERSVLNYEYHSAISVSAALCIGMLFSHPDWQLGLIAIWCLATAYFVFPTMYNAKALYGCIMIHVTAMVATVLYCYLTMALVTATSLIANIGLCVFAGTTAAFMGRQLRSTYVAGLKREQQLACAVHDLDRENEAKTSFVGNLSHQIRTPLHGILGMAALMRRDASDPEERQRLDVMLRSGANLERLLSDSLDLARLEVGAMPIDSGAYSLRDLVQDQVTLYAAVAEQKGLRMTFMATQNVPDYLLLDSRRVIQCVGNLLSNAVKFSDDGEIKVILDYERDINAPTALVTVIDQGVGIPLERHRNIFRAYSQGDTPGRQPGPGVGLGLAVTNRLATLMGGTLNVKSVIGQGSTFCFRFIAIEATGPHGIPPAFAG